MTIRMPEWRARLERTMRWLRANGVTEDASEIVDNVQLEDGRINYAVIRRGWVAPVRRYLGGALHIKREDGDVYAAGGRITQTPNDDGSVRVQVSGGRFAKRTSGTTADVYCGDCGHATQLERIDGGPLSNHEIADALAIAEHVNCPARKS